MTTTLITGVGGFCGRHLANYLSHVGGQRLVGIGRGPDAPKGLQLDEYHSVDMSREDQVADAIERLCPDRIYHLAGQVRAPAAELYRVNLLGAVYLLESVRRFVPESRVLVVGSAAEYGKVDKDQLPIVESQQCRPFGPYALSKHGMTMAALDYAQTHCMKVVVVRPFNIIGAGVPHSLVVGAILQRIKQATSEDPVVRTGNLDTQRDFVDVADVVRAYCQLLEDGPWGQVFNICSGRPYSIRSVVERLLSFSPLPLRLQCDPTLARPTDVSVVFGSCQKVQQVIGFEPNAVPDQALRAAWQYEMELAVDESLPPSDRDDARERKAA